MVARLEPAAAAHHRRIARIGIPCQVHAMRALKARLFLRLIQGMLRPPKVTHRCPTCGLMRPDHDAVHCKACGGIMDIQDDGLD